MTTPTFKKINLETYKPGRSLLKKNKRVIKLSANESALGISDRAKKVLKILNKTYLLLNYIVVVITFNIVPICYLTGAI